MPLKHRTTELVSAIICLTLLHLFTTYRLELNENLTQTCKDVNNFVSCSYEKDITLTFSISNSFFFLDGSSTHKIIWRTLEHGRFFSPIVILTKLCRSWFAKCSMPTGIVADTSMVWWSWEMSSKISNTCCWKPIFNMVST